MSRMNDVLWYRYIYRATFLLNTVRLMQHGGSTCIQVVAALSFPRSPFPPHSRTHCKKLEEKLMAAQIDVL